MIQLAETAMVFNNRCYINLLHVVSAILSALLSMCRGGAIQYVADYISHEVYPR